MIGVYSAIIISLIPFLLLFTQIQIMGNFTYAFGNISGFIGATLLLWQFVFGIKELANMISPKPGEFMKLHLFLGVWGMFFVLLHPILEMFSYMEHISFLIIPDFTSPFKLYLTLGRFAFFFVITIWLTSVFMRNKLSYRNWYIIHLLSYPMLFFVFIHALFIGSFLNTFMLIKIYWILLIGIYSGIVIWRLYSVLKNIIIVAPNNK